MVGRRKTRAVAVAALLVLAALFVVSPATGLTAKTYVGPNGGDWNVAENWSPSGIPTAEDEVTILSKTVVVKDADAVAGAITSFADSRIEVRGVRLTLADASANLVNGLVALQGGTIAVDGSAKLAHVELGEAGNPVSTGTLLINGSASFLSVIEKSPGAGLFRISPTGSVLQEAWSGGHIETRFENDGSFAAETTVWLYISAGSPSSDGSLVLSSSVFGSPGRLILQADPEATFPLSSASSVTGTGTFTVQGVTGGAHVAAGAEFAPDTVEVFRPALLDLDADGTTKVLTISGGVPPFDRGGRGGTGTLTVTGPATSTLRSSRFQEPGTTIFHGPVDLTGTSGAGVVDGARLVTNGATTVNGDMVLGNPGGSGLWENGGSLTFDGRFLSDRGGGLLRNLAGGTILVRGAVGGEVSVENAGAITVNANFGSASLGTYGTLVQNGGATTIAASGHVRKRVTLNGGKLSGSGTVLAVDNVGGTVEPGSSVGTLSVTETFAQRAGGTLRAEIASAGSFDRLAVTGAVTLGGTLAIVTDEAFTPALADRFRLVSAAARTNTFELLTGTQVGARRYLPQYPADGFELCVVEGAASECGQSGGADADGDGVGDAVDNCPSVPNPDQRNTDGDAEGDACDPDDDNDTVADGADNCPTAANVGQEDTDGDGQGDACDADDDNDTVADVTDNCPLLSNPAQEDSDADGLGNRCDPDDDNDTVADGADNCPTAANPGQENLDGDGLGDVCDPDDDNDAEIDGDDNCPRNANPGQQDTDDDGAGDACDGDDDADQHLDEQDNCPLHANPAQEDRDQDGVGNVCDGDIDNDGRANEADNCPDAANPGQEDLDEDGRGDPCDADDDNDEAEDGVDNCPRLGNPDQADNDRDGLGDACDSDDDNDGHGDTADNCPFTSNTDQRDSDGDGRGDACDDGALIPARPNAAIIRAAQPAHVGTVWMSGATSTLVSQTPVKTYEWDFNDDGRYDATCPGDAPAIERTFRTAGQHEVAMRLTDTAGRTDTTSTFVRVTNTQINKWTKPQHMCMNPGGDNQPDRADCVKTYSFGIVEVNGRGSQSQCFQVSTRKVKGGVIDKVPPIQPKFQQIPRDELGKIAIVYNARISGPVSLNGLYLPIPERTETEYNADDQEVRIPGTYTVSVLGAKIADFRLFKKIPETGPNGRHKLPRVLKLTTGGIKALGGLKIGGAVEIDLVDRATEVKISLKLPNAFTFGYGRAAEGFVTMRGSNTQPFSLAGARIGPIPTLWLGPLLVEDLIFDYRSADHFWKGGAKFTLGPVSPVKINATPPPADYGFGMRNGRFDHAGGGVIFPLGSQPPLFPGIGLQEIGGAIGVNPYRFTGRIAVNVVGVVVIDGSVFVGLASPQEPYVFPEEFAPPGLEALAGRRLETVSVAVGGKASIQIPLLGKLPLASAYVFYGYPDYLEFGGAIGVDLSIIKLDGSVNGFILVSKGRFNLEGRVRVCIVLDISITEFRICAGVEAVVSSRGLGACLFASLPIVGDVGIGAGVAWGEGPSVQIGSCTIAPWREIRPFALNASGQARSYSFELPSGLPSANVRVVGPSAPPDFVLTAPDGRRFVVPHPNVDSMGQGYVAMRRADQRAMVVSLLKPMAGRWTVTPTDGSPIANVAVAEGLNPPRVKGRVSGSGRERTLTYDVAPARGQRVTFVEQGPRTYRELGVARAPRGTIEFRPGAGSGGTRKIVAVVERAGMPAQTLDVTRYSAPGPVRPTRPRGVRAVVRRKTIIVTWRKAEGAARYSVTVRQRNGRIATRLTRGTRLVLRGVDGRSRGTIGVGVVTAQAVRGPEAVVRVPPRARP